jgi:hypothetical protein
VFRIRGITFRKTVLYRVIPAHKIAWTDVCEIYQDMTLRIYNRLPEDESSGSKRIEDTKKLKIELLIKKRLTFLSYIYVLLYTAR